MSNEERLPALVRVKKRLARAVTVADRALFGRRYRLMSCAGGKLYIPLGESYRMREKALGVYEYWKTELLCSLLKPEMKVVDAGANVGYFTLLCSQRVGPAGRVLALEPSPDVFGWLGRSMSANRVRNVKLVDCALSSHDGEIEFFVGRLSGWGSTINYGPTADPERASIRVRARTLDELLQTERMDHVDLIKIDVEGAEVSCLHGALRTLHELDARLIIDIHQRYHHAKGELLQLLADAGYTSYRIGRQLTRIRAIDPSVREIYAVKERPGTARQ